MRMSGVKLTAEQCQEAINRYKAGDGVTRIAREIGCSTGTIYNLMRKAELKPDRRPDLVRVRPVVAPKPKPVRKPSKDGKYVVPKPKTLQELYPGLVENCYDNRGRVPYWLAHLKGGYNVMTRDVLGDFEVRFTRIKSLERALKFWEWHVKLFDAAFEGTEMEECDD